ncbi:hypothetical protein AVEN_156707-1, partial [Araneus ventricosus]
QQWLNGKASASGLEGSRLETRFRRRSAVHVGLLLIKSYVVAKCPPVGVVPTTHPWGSESTRMDGEVLVLCGSLVRGCQLRRRLLHLTAVKNYEVRPKIDLALFQNGTLI